MITNFFTQIYELDLTGNLNIAIKKSDDNFLTVSVFLKNDSVKDKALKSIKPLVFTNRAEEFDKSFFTAICNPISKVSDLISDCKNYEIELQETKKKTEQAKAKREKEKKEAEKKKANYDKAIQKVTDLKNKGEFRKAWLAVPNQSDYPKKAKELTDLKKELSSKFDTGLFSNLKQA